MSRKSKGKQKPFPQQKQAGPLRGQDKPYWPRSDILAAFGIIVAIIATLLSLTIPEIRQFIGLDPPTPSQSSPSIKPSLSPDTFFFRLQSKYIGYPVLSDSGARDAASSARISLSIDWESPGGDVAGFMSGTSLPISCTFKGTVTTDMHFRFACQNSNQSFDGYIYSTDQHIKGTLSNGSSLTLWSFDIVDNSEPANTMPTLPPTDPPVPISTHTSP